MNRIGACLAAGVAVWLAVSSPGQTSSPRKDTAKTKKSTAKKKSSGVRKTATKPSGKASKSKKAVASRKAAAPRGQQHPTPERYKQIEEVLAARGYLQEEPTGKWGPNSVAALRSFQADHQLPPTGRQIGRASCRERVCQYV